MCNYCILKLGLDLTFLILSHKPWVIPRIIRLGFYFFFFLEELRLLYILNPTVLNEIDGSFSFSSFCNTYLLSCGHESGVHWSEMTES